MSLLVVVIMTRPYITSDGLRDLEVLDAEDVERGILDEEDEAALGRVEAVPEGELDGAGEVLLGGGVLDGEELHHAADDVVVGEDLPLVLSLGAVRHQPVLVQRHHHVRTAPVHLVPQRPREEHLEGVRRRLRERRLRGHQEGKFLSLSILRYRWSPEHDKSTQIDTV